MGRFSAFGAIAALFFVSACAYDGDYDTSYGVTSYYGGYDGGYGYDSYYAPGYPYGYNPLYDDYYGTPLTTFGVGLGRGYYDLGPPRGYRGGYLGGYGGGYGYGYRGNSYPNGFTGNGLNGGAPRGGAAPGGNVAPGPTRAAPSAAPPSDDRRTQFRRGAQAP
jgi:hypothetical protein